jgi:hypothetical protein
VPPKAVEKSKYPLLLEFWLLLLLPWILDSYSTRAVLTSVFGATLWGIALALAVARARTRDEKFRARQGWILCAICVLWMAYWIYSFSSLSHPATGFEAPRPDIEKWLLISHAGLLAAGAGMVAVLWASSLLWIFQERSLRQSSWQRRRSRWRLPSLEALGKVARGSMDGAFASWGLGFFLAMISGILRWRSHGVRGEGPTLGWITDTRVWATALLWVLLVAGFQAGHLMSSANRWLYRLYVVLGTLFWVAFVYGLMMGHHSDLHEPVSWFLQ